MSQFFCIKKGANEFENSSTPKSIHPEYIENSFNFEYSNARVEGSIRKIKVLKNIAYGFRGFRSFVNFKKRILLCANF